MCIVIALYFYPLNLSSTKRNRYIPFHLKVVILERRHPRFNSWLNAFGFWYLVTYMYFKREFTLRCVLLIMGPLLDLFETGKINGFLSLDFFIRDLYLLNTICLARPKFLFLFATVFSQASQQAVDKCDGRLLPSNEGKVVA